MEGNSTSSSAAKPRGRIENVGPSLCPNSVPGCTPLAHQKQACLPCQSRKVKCDGNGSVCSQCSKRGLHCAYKQRRTRGLGKGKEHVRELEERLEKLEQFLRAQGEARGEDAGSDDARRESPQTTSDKNSPLPIGMPPPRVESPNAMPSTTTPQPPQTTKPPGFIRLPELSRLPRSTYMEMITRSSNTGGFPMKVFIPLHPQADLVGLVASTAEEVGDTYPLFTPGYVKALTDQVVNSSQDNPAYEPTLLAISSSLVAIGVQWKAENSSLAQLSPMMWSHFKNAFAMLPYLMTKGPSVLSFHALVLMAVFLQGSAEMRLATHLIASAVRVAQMAGIPIRNQGHSVPAELNLRAFWTMCTLDVEISNRLMILPTIDDHHLPLTLPSQQPLEPMTGSTEEQVRILSFQAGLATTRSKIHKQYLLHTNQPRVSLVDIEPLDRFEEQLELWAHSLPPDFKPLGIDHRSPKQLPLSIILLQSQYYHSRCTLSALRAALQNLDPEHTTPLPADVSSARATIRLLSAISAEQEQFCCIWRVLIYPLSMVLLLLYDVLRDPKAPGAQSSVLAIEEFVNYLKRIKQDLACDVNCLLEGCAKMHKVARFAIFPQYPLPATPKSNLDNFGELCKRLCRILASRTNYLPLAQRLMGDMPNSENEVLGDLTKALLIDWDCNDAHGPFVPDVLKADSYNFGFEFMP